ncbi:hypothetical protein HNQ91_003640 [Filimonas zeae]|nr:hypothetical protein [Filimonas zeae]
MLQIEKLIRQTRSLLLNPFNGLTGNTYAFIQQYQFNTGKPNMFTCNLHTALIAQNNLLSLNNVQLDVQHLIQCAKELIYHTSLGMPLPVIKKVQAFSLFTHNNHPRIYHLCVTLSLPGCKHILNNYNIKS